MVGLRRLVHLNLNHSELSDVSALAGLTNLTSLYLTGNKLSDIAPLVANTGLDSGDEVALGNNPLNEAAINTHIPALEARGVTVIR